MLMVGKTERTLRRNVLLPLERMLGPKRMRVVQGQGEAWILGRHVYLVGANDERAEQKIRGMTLADAYGDEVTLWPQSFFAQMMFRLSTPGAAFFGTTNPDAPLHWLKRDYIDRAGELDVKHWHFQLTDNPYLDEDFVTAIGREYSGLWRKRFVEGAWVAAEGAIWDTFDAEQHCSAVVPEGLVLDDPFVGVDYGTANPFVALLIARGSDDRYWVLDEYRWDSAARGRQKTDAEYRVDLAERWPDRKIVAHYPDPSAASFRLELLRSGVRVLDAANEVDDGLRFVAGMIANDRLRVLVPACDGLVAEMQSYCWDQKAQLRGIDQPLKRNDHGPDALRYGLYSHVGRPRVITGLVA
jgi:PBSX family phage terminase large subunit